MNNTLTSVPEQVKQAPVRQAAQVVRKVWNYCEPADTTTLYTLMTIGGIAVTGLWQGDLGEHFIAYAVTDADAALCGQLH